MKFPFSMDVTIRPLDKKANTTMYMPRSQEPSVVTNGNHSASNQSDAASLNIQRRSSASLTLPKRGSSTPSGHDGAHQLATLAAHHVKKTFRESLPYNLQVDYNNKDCLAPFDYKEIKLGPLLGTGEFSNVYEIESFSLNPDVDAKCSDEEESDARLFMKRYEKYRDTKKPRYALKHLKEEYLEENDPLDYAQAARDLAMEAEFLSTLQHPHIIKIRGISMEGSGGFKDGPSGYFLVIDWLSETLDQRIEQWSIIGERDRNNNIMDEQVHAMVGISAALKFLHGKRVVFRDLKPTNIGFDVRGDVKLFDFGLACILPPNGDSQEDTFEMSGAGSPRYMAPEVLIDEPYNVKADVYSFVVVLWETLSLEMPYSFVTSRDMLEDCVVNQNRRPIIDPEWPFPLKRLMMMGFDADMNKRPSMHAIFNTLCAQLKTMRDGDGTGLNDESVTLRRSVISNRSLVLDDTAIQASHNTTVAGKHKQKLGSVKALFKRLIKFRRGSM